jgi:DNA primase
LLKNNAPSALDIYPTIQLSLKCKISVFEITFRPMISRETIQQILSRLDIIDVIGGFVKLKKRGTNYLGLCPFHNEKTPSFTVSPAKEIYKCFGCGRSGNTVSFIMEHEKYSYPEALRWLANKYNIDIEETYQSDEQKQQVLVADSLFIINEFGRDFFSHSLFETDEGKDIGLAYFRERGFREATIKKFQLGYSPEQRDAFSRAAIEKQFNPELLLKSGLVVNRNEQLVDNYRGRVIFPIHNHSGKVLGFGARILKSNEKAPKYINTPENEIYIKSRILYGSYLARQPIEKSDECLLVEGYTDVISLHQAGVENTVASGGTSLTTEQLRLVKKYSNNLTIIYDGDAAGIKAALRGLDLALEEGLHVKLVLLPPDEDPDSYVNKVGASAFNEYIRKNKKDFILFQLEVALRDAGNDAARKSEVVNQVAATISKINKAEDFTRQQDYIKQCAEKLHIDEAGLHSLVNKFIRERIVTLERKTPESANSSIAGKKEVNADYDDASFNLLFKDELQEREVARILLELGQQRWDEQQTVADHIFSEMVEDSLIDNREIVSMFHNYREKMQEDNAAPTSQYFVYHPDHKLSALAVSLLNFPYEESDHWKREFSQATGYQTSLFRQDYNDFISTLAKGSEEHLMSFLKTEEDTSHDEVDSAINYLKLRKVKRLLLENQVDMEKPHSDSDRITLFQTHEHLKKMEIDLTKRMGAAIIR